MSQINLSSVVNHRFILAQRPEPFVAKLGSNILAFEEARLPEIQDGQVLVRNHWLSLDPSTRGWMSATHSYTMPTPLGEVARAFGAGVVIQSRHPDFEVGARVSGFFGFQEYAVMDGNALKRAPANAPLRAAIGVLGINGITAWVGLNDICAPKAGDTVVVTAAAGAVGSVVVQLAVSTGATVIGMAGSQDKCDFLTQLGATGTINYKTDDVSGALSRYCPNGINCVFDNVGGVLLDTMLLHIAVGARIALCGQISRYDGQTEGLRNWNRVLFNRATMRGFIFLDNPSLVAAAEEDLCDRLSKGQLIFREEIIEGLKNAPKGLEKLFDGSNRGKLLVRIAVDGGFKRGAA
jgi:NADPH-dependent curcumin reductase CurA